MPVFQESILLQLEWNIWVLPWKIWVPQKSALLCGWQQVPDHLTAETLSQWKSSPSQHLPQLHLNEDYWSTTSSSFWYVWLSRALGVSRWGTCSFQLLEVSYLCFCCAMEEKKLQHFLLPPSSSLANNGALKMFCISECKWLKKNGSQARILLHPSVSPYLQHICR